MCKGAEMQHLFGIEVAGNPLLVPGKVKTRSGRTVPVLTGYQKRERDPKKPLLHSLLKVTTGKPLAQTEGTELPLIIVNEVGKGKAIYLNFSLSDYSRATAGGVGGEIVTVERAKREKQEAIWEIMADLLRLAGVEARVKVTEEVTGASWAPEVIRFQDGEAEYIGFLQPVMGTHTSIGSGGLITKADTKRVTIDFGREAHIYDVIRKRYHGEADRIETDLTDGKAALYALLPRKVENAKLRIDESLAPGQAVGGEVTVDGVSRGVVAIVLSNASGRERYRVRVSLMEGTGRFRFLLALNEEPGMWRIEATDVVSGTKTAQPFEVKPR